MISPRTFVQKPKGRNAKTGLRWLAAGGGGGGGAAFCERGLPSRQQPMVHPRASFFADFWTHFATHPMPCGERAKPWPRVTRRCRGVINRAAF